MIRRVKRAGCILLAAAVLGTGAWAVDKGQGSDVPELTSFVDLDDQTSINEDEVPLAFAPKTSVKTKTSTTKKIVNLKKKAKKTYTKKSAPKSVKSPTITRTSAAATITTKKVTTTYVTKKYKKNSKKMTMITTKKIKTTVTTVARKSSGTAGTDRNADCSSLPHRHQTKLPLQAKIRLRTRFPPPLWHRFLIPEL